MGSSVINSFHFRLKVYRECQSQTDLLSVYFVGCAIQDETD